MKAEIIKSIHNDVSGLFKIPDDPARKQEKIEDFADTFMKLYNRTQQHQ